MIYIDPVLAMGTPWFLNLIVLCYHCIISEMSPLPSFDGCLFFQVNVLIELPLGILLLVTFFFPSFIVMLSQGDVKTVSYAYQIA
jgi:hypothetical protein